MMALDGRIHAEPQKGWTKKGYLKLSFTYLAYVALLRRYEGGSRSGADNAE